MIMVIPIMEEPVIARTFSILGIHWNVMKALDIASARRKEEGMKYRPVIPGMVPLEGSYVMAKIIKIIPANPKPQSRK